MAEKKPDPISMRLSQDAIDAIQECGEITGLKRSAVVEFAVRKWRDELQKQRAMAPAKKKKNSGEGP